MEIIIKPEAMVDWDPTDFHALTASDKEWGFQVMRKLIEHYPHHDWAVFLDSEKTGGIVKIQNYDVTGTVYGYVLHLADLFSDPDLKCVVRAGGEMLERANVRRGWKEDDLIVDHIDGIEDKYQPFEGGLIP